MGEIVWCNHSNESSLAVLLHGGKGPTALTFENEHSSFYFAVKTYHPYLLHLIKTEQKDNVLPQKKNNNKTTQDCFRTALTVFSIVVFSLIIILRKR